MKIENFNSKLFDFINNATCSFACIDVIKNELLSRGFVQVYENEKWNLKVGKYFVIRNDASIIAFSIGFKHRSCFNIICTHWDTPGFSLKPKNQMFCIKILLLVMIWLVVQNYQV